MSRSTGCNRPPKFYQSTPELSYVPKYPAATTYQFMAPPTLIHGDEEDMRKLDTLLQWKRGRSSYQETPARGLSMTHLIAEPTIIWCNGREGVFEMGSAPRKPLKEGDKLECFGRIVDECRMRGEKISSHEWLYCVWKNDGTVEKTGVKMARAHFASSSLFTRLKSAFRKFGSLFRKYFVELYSIVRELQNRPVIDNSCQLIRWDR
ncbi:hypothetical protein B0H19DRAFT_1068797 [Mycena capillaripes]|nr:hypothetical protein B0H19DRAFT_1068797 [Mycena capillaripes]